MKPAAWIAGVVCLCAAAFAQEEVSPLRAPLPGKYATRAVQGLNVNTAVQQAAAATTIPIWVGKAGAYPFAMVGNSPAQAETNQTSTVTAQVVPVIFTFAGGRVFDPTAVDPACSPAGSAANLTAASPLFNNFNYVVGGTAVGNTQYVDFFQRANFWAFTKPGSLNPDYHVLLSNRVLPAIHITVPSSKGSVITSVPCGALGQIEINWWDNALQKSIIPAMNASGVNPTTLPIFLVYNVVLYDTTPSNCCILGYHGSYANPAFSNHFQTYITADFDRSGAFGASTADISALSHEVAEWMDDPAGTNPTPPWGNIGQVTGCQSNLEDGDPLSGTVISVTMPNNYVYHPQELAFVSWFFHLVPSIGVNGWYSSNNSFTAPPPICH